MAKYTSLWQNQKKDITVLAGYATKNSVVCLTEFQLGY